MKNVLFLLLLMTGCDKLLHREEADAQVTSTATATTTTMPTPEATATPTPTASAASDWPSYLPDYPGATVIKKTSSGGSGKYELLESKDPRDKVVAFYKERLTAAGFPPGASASLGTSAKDPNASTSLTMSKGSTMVMLTVTPSGGVTKISISLPP